MSSIKEGKETTGNRKKLLGINSSAICRHLLSTEPARSLKNHRKRSQYTIHTKLLYSIWFVNAMIYITLLWFVFSLFPHAVSEGGADRSNIFGVQCAIVVALQM